MLAIGRDRTRRQEGSGEYIDGTVITGKVKAAIFNDPSLKSAQINVQTFKGVVQMSGFIGSQAEINQAVLIARRIKGVTAVKNNVRIKGAQ
jgi:osmotically-inducible protein OsmY